MPKGCQNGAQTNAKTNPSEINAKAGIEKDHENHKNHICLKGK